VNMFEMLERINEDWYNCKLEYPSSIGKNEIAVITEELKRDEKLFKQLSSKAKNLKELDKLIYEEVDRILQERLKGEEEKRKLYREEVARLHNLFEEDLYREFDVQDNPRRENAFSYAWQEGHAYGYREVYVVFSDVVGLIRD